MNRHSSTSRVMTALGAAIVLFATGCLTSRHESASTPREPTFTRDVAPVMFANCSGCHRPGGIGPMSLLTYEDAKTHATDIRDMVGRGAMPPWHADAPRGTFANDRRLSDSDRDAILRWVDAGTPLGRPSDLPPQPVFEGSWTIGTPDVVVSMQRDFDVPASGEVRYQYFEVPSGLTEDKWVQAIEILPGAREVVHHVLAYAREPGVAARPPAIRVRVDSARQADSARAARQRAASGREARPLGALIATTAPGTNAIRFPEGTALRLGAGTVFTFQMHYTPHGHATKDRTRLGIVFAKAPPVEEIHASAFTNGRFVIPAGASDHRVDSELSFTEPVHVWGLFPHTHLRGKRWEYRLVGRDSSSRVILSMPRYDFNWQTFYMFAEPLAIPAGARIDASAWYDNSAANPSNPDPKAAVRWGDQTWEEMQYTGFLYSVDSKRRSVGAPRH
jgi:mono/diheme cytochrome c family protein